MKAKEWAFIIIATGIFVALVILIVELKDNRKIPNEGLMCYPACWNQMVAFGKDTAFQKADVTVLNITVDPKSRWAEAIAKMPELASATVLFDEDRRVSTTYGVLNATSSMHRGQFPGHSYILIDKNGIVRFIKDDPEMAVRNQELLKVIETL